MGVVPVYETLVAPYLDDLRKYCFYLTKSRWDGEDLFQEALLRSLLFFVHTEPYMDVKPFLIRVARNLWIDDCRKKTRRRLAQTQPFKTHYTDSDYIVVRSAIEWLAERFPRRNIEMWLLSQHFGYSMQEIADEMDCSVSAVKSVLFRTRDMLRNRSKLPEYRKVIPFEVERWSKAVMQERPKAVLSKG